MSIETNKRLIPFLRNLADSIENGDIMPKELQRIGEFFMSYQFQKQADKDNLENENTEMFTKKELIKFVSLGWYVYQILLNNRSLPFDEDLD